MLGYVDNRTDAEKLADMEIAELRAQSGIDPDSDYAGMLEDRLARVLRELYERPTE